MKEPAMWNQKTKVYWSFCHMYWFKVTLGELLICCEFNLMPVSFHSLMAQDELCCSNLPRLIQVQ